MSKQVIEQKKLLVDELVKKIKDAAGVAVLDYQGLTVEQTTQLRNNLRAEGCEMHVIKNNISRRAAEASGHKELMSSFTGPTAIAFSANDSIAAAKVSYDFAKANPKLELKVGLVDGEFMDNDTIVKIATTPSRDVLLTMLASGLLTPLKEFAIGLNMIAESMEA